MQMNKLAFLDLRRLRTGVRLAIALAMLPALTGCGGSQPHPAADASQAQQSATASIGDATVRASVVPTSSLDAGVARQYGIARSEGSALLLVSLRREAAPAGDATRANVQATASDLTGHGQQIKLREIRTGDEVDYVGSVAIEPPDTVHFDVRVERKGARASLQFDREFFPR